MNKGKGIDSYNIVKIDNSGRAVTTTIAMAENLMALHLSVFMEFMFHEDEIKEFGAIEEEGFHGAIVRGLIRQFAKFDGRQGERKGLTPSSAGSQSRNSGATTKPGWVDRR